MDLKVSETQPIEYTYALMIYISWRRRPHSLMTNLARFIINLRATKSEEERLYQKVDYCM